MMTNPWTRRWRFDNGIGPDIDNYIGRWGKEARFC